MPVKVASKMIAAQIIGVAIVATPMIIISPWILGCGEAFPDAPAPQAGTHWDAVSELLGVRCGSLDCHGQTARPLRLYHRQGLRLDAADVPGSGKTRPAEHDANLRSTLALEPELIAQVQAEQGRDPERLSLLRKALGVERHKGSAVIARGSSAELCLHSWLAGATDVAACEAGASLVRAEP